MLEPITLPITISEDPSTTLSVEVANSGSEVPKAIIVTPIMKGEIPKESPIVSDALINFSDAKIKTATHMIKSIILTINQAHFFPTAKVSLIMQQKI